MVRKKLATAVLAFSTLQAGLASALGLGELDLNSALNQPLDAQIRLLDTGELDPNQISIRLAATEDFDRAGVDRDFFLTNLKFKVELDGRGNGVIRVSTREPVIEPFLNFLLEARWPNGRLLREYTVLMDLPTFSDGAAQTVVPAASRTQSRRTQPGAAPAPRAQQVAAPARSNGGRAPTQLPEATASGEYRVQHSDTMYEIAARFRPDSQVSVQQTMLAIQRLNPRAFINNNVNLVKSGYILRLPNADEARGLDREQALAEVSQQNRTWRSGASGAGAEGPQLDGREGGSAGDAGSQSQARLSIATAGDSDRVAAGEGTGRDAGSVTALRNQLASSQESLDKAQRENDELQSRLGDMERQIATLKRLIELKDDQLAAMQEQAGDASNATATDTVARADAEASVEQPVDFNYQASEDEQADSQAAAPALAPEEPAEPAPQPPAPEPEPGLFEQITSNPLYLAAGGGVLVLALIAAMVAARRRRQAEEEQEIAEEEMLAEEGGLSLDDDEPLEFDDSAFDEALAETEQQAERSDESTVAGGVAAAVAGGAAAAAASQPVRSETGDAIAEADIYIAYGRYQQAADLLQSAIHADPQRSDLRVKLLEVFVESRDKAAFQQQFVELEALGDEDAVVQVKEHLSTVDGVADWLDDLPGSGAAGVAAASTVAQAAEQAEEEFDLDLDLDEDFGPQSADEAGSLEIDEAGLPEDFAVEADAESGDTDFDFDLELDTLEPESAESAVTSELDELDLALGADSVADADTSESALDDNGELDLSGLDLDEPVAGGGESVEEESGLDLNLEGDDDFDLALADSDSGELSDLDLSLDEDVAGESVSGSDFDLGGDDSLSLGSGNSESDWSLDSELELDSGSLESPELADLDLDSEAGLELESEIPENVPETKTEPEADEDPFASVDETATAESSLAEDDDSEEFDFLGDSDEVATKLDLARAYIDMGDVDGARDILDEVMQEGNDGQKQDAQVLLARL